MTEETLRQFTLWVALAAEVAAALVIAIALVEAAGRVAAGFFAELHPRGRAPEALHKKQEIRLRLARWLALSLEFLLAADILKTAVAPTWTEIGQLAAIAALRTALNFFLEREIAAAGKLPPEAERAQ